ncbi:MAG TPA: DNA-binding protein, partial [Candidatus Obscuribacter sp.]|nr:DNA-binding protein [Candidatus Obscuribacter sp.]
MTRGPNIDQGELFEVADRLESEGKEVTALAVQTALGRGSYTTVYKYLEAWRASRPAPVAPVSFQMPDPVKNIFAGAWRMALMESAKETEAVKVKAAEDLKNAAAQLHGALQAIEKLELAAEASATEIASL